MRDRSKWCATCGRERKGLEQQRTGWQAHPKAYIPEPENPTGKQWQSFNDLIVIANVYRNGGAGDDGHLCDACLAIGLRALKIEVDRALGAADATTEAAAEIACLTRRLALSQSRRSAVAYEHDRMQKRFAELLRVVDALMAGGPTPQETDEILEMARFETARGSAIDAIRAERAAEAGHG